jgi:hypothetical protein
MGKNVCSQPFSCAFRDRMDEKSLTTSRVIRENHPDYVIRRFNASLVGLKKPMGLILRWNIA